MMWANINHCPKKLSALGHGHEKNEKPNHSDENNNEHSIENGLGHNHGKTNGKIFCSQCPPKRQRTKKIYDSGRI